MGSLRSPGFRRYVLRAAASLAVAFFMAELVWLFGAARSGPEAGTAALRCLARPWAVALNTAILAASLLHTFTWFDRRSSWVTGWIVASALVLWWVLR